MNLNFTTALVVILGFIFSSSAFSTAEKETIAPDKFSSGIQIFPESDSVNIGANIQFIKDNLHSISIESLIEDGDIPWQLSTEETPNLGVDPATFWFKQRIKFIQTHSKLHQIELAYPALDVIDVYFVQNQQIIKTYHTGDKRLYHERPIEHRNFLFPLPDLSNDSPLDVYVKVRTSGAMQVPLYIWKNKAFWEQDQLQLMLHTFFIAILLTIGLYNLMLFVSLRDTTYLLYVLYIGCLTITQMGLRGLSYQILVPYSPFINERLLLVSIGLSVFFACLFARKFMAVKHNRPAFNKLLLLVAFIAGVQAIGGFIMPYSMNLKMGIIITAIACPILLLVGVVQWLSGYKVARFYTLAWVIYLFGQFAITLSKLGFIARTTWVEHGPEIGASIEVILLSFALADRMNEERRKRYAAQESALHHEKTAREAQEKALSIQHKANEELEASVDARTRELRETLSELSYANEKLHSLSTMDGLTEVGNRRSFDKALNREWRRCAREQVPLSLIILDADHFKRVNDHYGHQAGDECLKAIAKILCDSVKRPADAVARYGGEEFVIVLPNTPEEGAIVIAERIRSAIENTPVTHEDVSIKLTASIGLASTIPIAREAESKFLERADRALYKAKKQGRNRVIVDHESS